MLAQPVKASVGEADMQWFEPHLAIWPNWQYLSGWLGRDTNVEYLHT